MRNVGRIFNTAGTGGQIHVLICGRQVFPKNTHESLSCRFPEGRLHGVTPLTKASNTWHRLPSVKKTRASVSCKCLCTQHVDATSWQVRWQIGCTIGRLLAPEGLCLVASCASRPGHLKKGSTLKKITFATLLFCGVCVFGSPQGNAQDAPSQPTAADSTADALTDQQWALLRKDIRSIKKQLIAANLMLTETEATNFWPTCDQYSTETGKINDTRAAIIKQYSDEYGNQTDDQAEALIRRWLDTDMAKLRQTLCRSFERFYRGRKRRLSSSWTGASAR